jgi:hypothetical protein
MPYHINQGMNTREFMHPCLCYRNEYPSSASDCVKASCIRRHHAKIFCQRISALEEGYFYHIVEQTKQVFHHKRMYVLTATTALSKKPSWYGLLPVQTDARFHVSRSPDAELSERVTEEAIETVHVPA